MTILPGKTPVAVVGPCEGKPDREGEDWEEFTLFPPGDDGGHRTRWLTVDREHVVPMEECR